MKQLMLSRRSSSSHRKEELDRTCSVNIHSTYYYDEFTQNGKDYLTLIKVTGGYTIRDKSVKVVGQKVHYGQSSSAGNINYSRVVYPASYSWYYSAPSSWKPIIINPSLARYTYGISYSVTLQRYSAPWTYEMINKVVI